MPLQNIREIGKKCMSYKVKYVFMSSLTFSNRIYLISYSVLQRSERNNRDGLLRKWLLLH